MTELSRRSFRKLAVIDAGTLGSGIAQKIATKGLDVVLVEGLSSPGKKTRVFEGR